MDGTIADTMPLHAKAWECLFQRYGIQIDARSMVRETAGMTIEEIVEKLGISAATNNTAAKIGAVKESIYRDIAKTEMSAIPGILSFIDTLSANGMVRALASAASPENIRLTLAKLGLRSSFDAIIGGGDVERGKPNPDIFLAAAKKIGVAPERCLVFEDSLLGFDAALRAEMSFVAISTSHSADEIYERYPEGCLGVVRDFRDALLAKLLS